MKAYLPPKICWLPGGYGCAVTVPMAPLGATLRRGTGHIALSWRVWRGGACVHERVDDLRFEVGALIGADPGPFRWPPAPADKLDGNDLDGGYLEFAAETKGHAPDFTGGEVPAQYAAYSAPGRKSFFTCVQYKFGEPRVIAQIATFGRYVDGYPAVRLDRAKGLGESVAFVNPYKMPVLAEVRTSDGRALPRLRIPALSAKRLSLEPLLQPGEDAWHGSIQITGTNRVIAYTVKHDLADPSNVTKVEHMDPFRAEPTHLPAFRAFRVHFGHWAKDIRARLS
jgi:hypothetical protein